MSLHFARFLLFLQCKTNLEMEYSLKEIFLTMLENRKNGVLPPVKSSYRELAVKASVGMGVISYVPWISYCAKGQTTQRGIYPVLLFYGTPEFVKANTNKTIVKKIILAYGISATNKPLMTWGNAINPKKTIGEALKDWNYKTNNIYIKKYNSSYVYKAYDWTDKINFNKIQEDLDRLIDTYTSIIKEGKKYKPIEEASVPSVSEPKTPDIPITVKLSDLAASANATLPDSLLDAVKKIKPQSFEVLIKKLLLKMGYGKSTDDVVVTQYSKDGGIDAYVNADALGIKKLCCVQAKRYNDSVDVKTVRELVGSLAEYDCENGIIITTSSFTKGAKDYNTKRYQILLVDGRKLADYMIKYGLGITTKQIEVKAVDTDYLNSL